MIKRRRHIAIVALTAYAMKGDDLEALGAGCDGYVAKPIDIETLPVIVREQLNRQRGDVDGAPSARVP